MSAAMPGQNMDASALDSIIVTPWWAAFRQSSSQGWWLDPCKPPLHLWSRGGICGCDIPLCVSACFSGNPSSMVCSRRCMVSSVVVCSLIWTIKSMTEHSVTIKSSSSSSSGWSTDSPAMRILGGGADTASGRDNLSGPVGYRDRALFLTPGMYNLVMSARALSPKINCDV